MFSALGQIILGKPRQAENADTRLGIRRHDPDQEQNRKKGEENSVAAEEFQDDPTVSVESLRVFLENFLQSLQNESAQTSDAPAQQDYISRAAPQAAAPISMQNAQAVNAYQNMARAAAKTSSPVSAPAAPEMKLASDEVRAIYKLLADLEILTLRGVEYVRIERSDTFLHSLEAAVAKAMQG